MAMTATSIFIRVNVWLKFILHLSTIVLYISFNNQPATIWEVLNDFFESQQTNWSFLDHKQKFSHLYYIILIAVVLHLIDRQVEYILSLNIQWSNQLESDRSESQTLGLINRLLLENILPPHVLRRYLYNTSVSYDQLYHESVSINTCIFFWFDYPVQWYYGDNYWIILIRKDTHQFGKSVCLFLNWLLSFSTTLMLKLMLSCCYVTVQCTCFTWCVSMRIDLIIIVCCCFHVYNQIHKQINKQMPTFYMYYMMSLNDLVT